MGQGQSLNQKSGEMMDRLQPVRATSRPSHCKWVVAVFCMCVLAVLTCAAQDTSPSTGQQQGMPDLEKYAPLISELSHLQAKLQEGVQFPAARTQSRLLPLLPSTATAYFAMPNYGEALHQADEIFHQQLQERPVLNEWWQKAGMVGLMVEGVIDKIHQFSQYIGNEIVITGALNQRNPSVLIVAEIKKPGLRTFLQDLVAQFGGKNPPVRIFNQVQLATAKPLASSNQFFVLVRPDFLVLSSDLRSLKRFNVQLNQHAASFATTPFGQRLNQAYQDGAGMLLGVDLQQILSQRPKGSEQDEAALRKTGFGDVKYLIADYKNVAGQSLANGELSFNGPRQGIAGWLAPPAPIGGLDFISSDASAVGAAVVKSLGQIFADIKDIASSANPMAEMGLAQMESELKINLKQDLFSKLLGEFTFALDGPIAPRPAWKAIVKVSDPAGLQQTISALVTAANTRAGEGKGLTLKPHAENGLTTYTLSFLKEQKREDIDYTFADGYLVVAGSRELVANAIQIHRSGKSLAKSGQFQSALPQNHPGNCSGVTYQSPGLMFAALTQQLSPQQAQLLQQSELMQNLSANSKPTVTCFYGEPAAIRMSSNSPGFEIAMVALPIAAIAIPNLMRSRTAAHESQAASTIRTLNTVQVMYSTDHGNGYAANLKALGPDSPLDCPAEGWCVNNAFKYSLDGSCDAGVCQDYVIVATPVDANKAQRSFCSTSDAVVRYRAGLVRGPVSVAECKKWVPVQ